MFGKAVLHSHPSNHALSVAQPGQTQQLLSTIMMKCILDIIQSQRTIKSRSISIRSNAKSNTRQFLEVSIKLDMMHLVKARWMASVELGEFNLSLVDLAVFVLCPYADDTFGLGDAGVACEEEGFKMEATFWISGVKE